MARPTTEALPPLESSQPVNSSREGSRAAMIAELAYRKWQARGCPFGDDRRDWLEAEEEIGRMSDLPGSMDADSGAMSTCT